MPTTADLAPLIQEFTPAHREAILEQSKMYDDLLIKASKPKQHTSSKISRKAGILALNGASGAGQSYVMKRVETLLQENNLELPRIYLLGTRAPRPDEGHKNPYIFVEETAEGFRDIHYPSATYSQSDIYYSYQSRPGAANAILLSDAQTAMGKMLYLETVIPTLLHIKNNTIGGIPPWGDNLKILYLAVPDGVEWVYRLLNREPDRLKEESFQSQILGRIESSISDMKIAVESEIPFIFNQHGKAEQAAQEILSAWGL